MRVVYSPVHLGHEIRTQTIYGVQVPANEVAERAERIRATLAADGGFELVEPTEHGEDPIIAVHDPGLLAFLDEAWPETRRAGIDPGLHGPGHVSRRSSPFEGMSDAVAPRAGRTSAAGPAIAGLDTSTPIVPGTYAAARSAVDVALTTVDLVLGGETAAYGLCRPPGHHAARSMYGGYCFFNNAAIAAEAIVGRTRRARRDPRPRLPPRQRHRADLLASRRRVVRLAPRRPGSAVPVLPRPRRRDRRGPGGRRQPQPAAAGRPDRRRRSSDALDIGLERIAGHGGSSSSSRSGSTRSARTRSATSPSRRAVYDEVGRRVAALGRRLVILQEGGYYVPALGDNARTWLAARRACRPIRAGGPRMSTRYHRSR